MSGPNRRPSDEHRVESGTDGVTIDWPDGQRSRHLHYWLRENCHCPQCTHTDAWERTLDFLAVPLDIAPQTVRSDEHGVHIEWPPHDAPCEGSFYSWAWLDAHRGERSARLARKKRPQAWIASGVDKAALSADFEDVMASDAGLFDLLVQVENSGVGFVTGMPCAEGTVVVFAERIAFIEESQFGRTFRVESKPNAENLAYTPRAL
ncbi:MAG: gamma-butyrobetaine hydroxylase-like domain-containing protein, partial [Gammaproteobacteria bacterium]|nr:gamma-butyrobetaine hydroxylase-like domain-containing protein [Gammaproteobacteria bacterium]